MRKWILAAAAALTLMTSGALTMNRADALPFGGPTLGTSAQDLGLTQDVRVVCRRVWNGFRWRTRCYNTGPVIFAPRRVVRPFYRPYRPFRHRRWR